MLRQDSLVITPPSIVDISLNVEMRNSKPQTPYQVLRLLPKDATPAQQDSAIQAWFSPGEIHYSERPDTLHLPGEGIPRDLKDINLPQYYRENFFSNSSFYHPELSSARYGISGDPVPELLSNDNLITGILLLCFLVMTFAFSRISGFFIRQVKNFFYTPKVEPYSIEETGSEMKIQLVSTTITCLLYSLLFYLYTTNSGKNLFIFSNQHVLIAIFFAVFIGFYLIRFFLYTVVNLIMFSAQKNKKFLTSLLFISTMEGVLLFPIALLETYFQFPIQNATFYCLGVLIFIKLLTFYKTYVIFFNKKELYLQIILYFCALEMVPLLSLWCILAVIVNQSRVIF